MVYTNKLHIFFTIKMNINNCIDPTQFIIHLGSVHNKQLRTSYFVESNYLRQKSSCGPNGDMRIHQAANAQPSINTRSINL